MQIRPIPDKDFDQLVSLYIKLYAALPRPISGIMATHGLASSVLSKTNFIAWGLYYDKRLQSFITGYEVSPGDFYFSGIYCANARHIKPLMDEAQAKIKELGYTRWESDATSANVEGLLTKYGAKPIHTRYRSEL